MVSWRTAKVWIGLDDDRATPAYDEYADGYADDYEEYPADGADDTAGAGGSHAYVDDGRSAVTPLRRVVAAPVREVEVTEMNRIATIHPSTYNDARAVGESFRAGTPVIMNLTDMDDADAKRLVDFAAGLVFGLHGSIERVTNKVFLLSPEHVEVDTDGGEAAIAHGPFNQS